MKKFTLFAFALFFAAAAHAAVPQLISFQGQLTDADGKVITTAKPIEFRLYDAATSGNLLFLEPQTVTPDSEGNYSVFIGTVTSLGGIDFNQNIWLQIFVAGEGLLPRYQLVSVPYAMYAVLATSATIANSVKDSVITNTKIVSMNATKLTGPLTVDMNGLLTVNNWTPIKTHLSTAATLNFVVPLAAGACEEQSITLAGAVDGDTVSLGVPSALANSDPGVPQTFFGYVPSIGGSVVVRRCNVGSGIAPPALSAASANVRADVWQHP